MTLHSSNQHFHEFSDSESVKQDAHKVAGLSVSWISIQNKLTPLCYCHLIHANN